MAGASGPENSSQLFDRRPAIGYSIRSRRAIASGLIAPLGKLPAEKARNRPSPNFVNALSARIERERAFVTALRYLENRIKLFIALPFDRLDALALRAHVREIGQVEGASTRRGDAA